MYRYFDEEEMIHRVSGIAYMGQTTNTPAALSVNLKYLTNFESPTVIDHMFRAYYKQ